MTQQAQSPMLNTSSGAMLGLGAPIVQVYDVSTLTANGTITLTPSSPFSKGRLRVKSSALAAAGTPALGAVTVTDGANTCVVTQQLMAAGAAGVNFDVSLEFVTDLAATSLSFPVTTAAACTFNSELFGNP